MTLRLITVAAYALPALLWTSIAQVCWHYLRRDRPRGVLSLIVAALTSAMVFDYALAVPLAVLPDGLPVLGTLLRVLRDVSLIGSVALLRHLLARAAIHEPPPTTAWLAGNYGIATAAAVVAALLVPRAAPGLHWFPGRLVLAPYFLFMLAASIRRMARLAQRGGWRAGGLGEVRLPDVLIVAGALLVLVSLVPIVGAGAWRPSPDSFGLTLVDAGLGVLLAVPFAARAPSETALRLITHAAMIGAAAALYVGAHALHGRAQAAGLGALVDLTTVLALVVVLGPGRARLHAGVYGLVLRRSRRRREEMQAFLRDLSPELGVLECCRRAAAAIARILQLRGVAILLRDGTSVVHGALALAPLAEVWPRGDAADALPARPFGAPNFWDLPAPLQAALGESDVVGVVPIISPRRCWGHLFATAGPLAAIYGDEDVQASAAFADRLALVLDAAELIARAVGVERSLAHAEKLAAIGETAARIAHDIRNPVTAARSLAQQLAREPGAPFAEEHAMILTELERVERRIAALLRFARREDLQLGPVDLAELVRDTVAAFRSQLEAAGIEVALDVDGAVTVRADAEKLRQLLVNLVENAIDALADGARVKRVMIRVARAGAGAMLCVADTGPGVPPDALPRLFEPFFSLKSHGTGLGLAIAKRTVDAHGGRIAAACPSGSGLTIRIELPLEGATEG